jgi:hypothetical protein
VEHDSVFPPSKDDFTMLFRLQASVCMICQYLLLLAVGSSNPIVIILSLLFCLNISAFLFLVQWGVESNWVHSALQPQICLLCQPRVIMMMEKLVEMMIGRGNWSTRRKSAPVPLCPPQTPHTARTQTRAAAVGSQRLSAWATARPNILAYFPYFVKIKLGICDLHSVYPPPPS